jgi:hypothetical protein
VSTNSHHHDEFCAVLYRGHVPGHHEFFSATHSDWGSSGEGLRAQRMVPRDQLDLLVPDPSHNWKHLRFRFDLLLDLCPGDRPVQAAEVQV